MPLGLHAVTNNLTSALQRGLFEEEANRNLDAAISNYQALAAQFDQDRQIAATAIFRLGECYRKLGQTNDAVGQYQRILREFSDQQTLATLSRQNLTGLGVAAQPRFQQRLQAIITKNPPDVTVSTTTAMSELEKEYILLKSQLELARGETNYWPVARLFGDTDLASALKRLEISEEGLRGEKLNQSSTNIAAHERSVSADEFYVEEARKSLLAYQDLRLRSLAAAIAQARDLSTTNVPGNPGLRLRDGDGIKVPEK
jgi:tetratricopeptide (TPR) repeat protein